MCNLFVRTHLQIPPLLILAAKFSSMHLLNFIIIIQILPAAVDWNGKQGAARYVSGI